MTEAELIVALESQGWSRPQILLGIQARFRCEYCHRYLLRSIEDYDTWQVDHIVPLSKGGTDDPTNTALACKMCNFMKRDHHVEGGGRAERKAAARKIVQEKRRRKEEVLAAVREVVNSFLIATER